jgi:DNA repair protein RadC
MSIKDWPAAERPREKLLAQGPASLSDAELLAIFLRTGTAGMSAVELARSAQSHFGGIRNLLTASLQEFSTHSGLGPAKFAQLQAALELARRHLLETLDRNIIFDSAINVRSYLQLELRDREQEIFHALFLDGRHRLICAESLFYGTINSATVHVREVVKRCLQLNAAALIIAHNHPSGVPEPSQSDIRLTQRLNEALQLVDIKLLDHFVVGDGEAISLAERGLI